MVCLGLVVVELLFVWSILSTWKVEGFWLVKCIVRWWWWKFLEAKFVGVKGPICFTRYFACFQTWIWLPNLLAKKGLPPFSLWLLLMMHTGIILVTKFTNVYLPNLLLSIESSWMSGLNLLWVELHESSQRLDLTLTENWYFGPNERIEKLKTIMIRWINNEVYSSGSYEAKSVHCEPSTLSLSWQTDIFLPTWNMQPSRN